MQYSPLKKHFQPLKYTVVHNHASYTNRAEDKVNVMLCVKVATDIPRAISTLVENNATHRAFLEIHINDLLNLEATAVPDWQNVYYTVHVSNTAEISTYYLIYINR